MGIMLLAKLAKPLLGTARIVINSIHIKGDVCKVLSCLDSLLFIHFYFLLYSLFIFIKFSNCLFFVDNEEHLACTYICRQTGIGLWHQYHVNICIGLPIFKKCYGYLLPGSLICCMVALHPKLKRRK